MSRFDAELYRCFRPLYPPETFAGMAERLRARGFAEPFQVADVGCGTGHSAASALAAGLDARITGVDPDPAMLAEARARELPAAEFREGRGEATGLADASADAVLLGSCFHWMDAAAAERDLRRILRPRGLARVFEYQFPKAPELPELNEWIRRQFNERWRAPDQAPRGDFRQVTAVFRARWELLAEGRPPMSRELGAAELAGLLLSQSRVRHYEDGLVPEARAEFRNGLARTLQERMGDRSWRFDFRLEWAEFARPA
jgi:SAM-dependent methyltransferase